MQCNLLSTSSISALLVLTLTTVFTESAFAQCVNSHVGVQLNISRLPAKQGSNIEMESTGPCTGNVNSSTATQVNIGGQGQAEQQQNVNQQIRGGRGNPTGVNGSTINNSVVIPINVKTPKNFNR
ncbi:MAG: hypothetical protein ACK52E_13265 [Aphanizomenon sp.]|jgi:hypothetical protein|uniref:Uncharacterized protein n=1 Tax=Aphanizomenon flos-aquae WA102 TaxID=1710896 RepID=A0A1B7X790_APHFL|nr:hypothetical protein [Dolichospermum lemmermannii]OBQ22218.1 MAG: hypothetical protein AN488_08830 [Anabaena sp. WA113]OBQ45259.1 MAG: hypothetical protein AN484_02700 [Aphanizomenon flos-aquae WA102]